MLVKYPRRLFVAVVLFPSLFVDGGTYAKEDILPAGCSLTTKFKKLHCEAGSLREILSAIRKLDVEWMNISDCLSAPVVELNRSCFENNTNLTRLCLSKCNVMKIAPRTFEKLSSLERLDLSKNIISQVHNETFKGLMNLSSLSLSGNEIYFVAKGAFLDVENLSSLYLDSNKIQQTPNNEMLMDVKNLKLLMFSDQRYTPGRMIEPPTIDMLHGLTRLGNLCLKKVSFADFDIETDLSLFFKDQEKTLEFLDLGSTDMTNVIIPMLKNLKHLKVLDLSGNYIGYILHDTLPKLVGSAGTLDLRSNRIMYIDENAFSYIVDGHIYLDMNNFVCDCKLLGFTKWLARASSAIRPRVDIDAFRCFGPVSWYLTKLIDYNPYWWQCSQYIPLIALLAIIGFAGLLALVTLVVACNRVNIKHWLLERRAAVKAEVEAEEQAAATERSALAPPGRLCGISSLPKGMTGAYILYNMDEEDVKKWVDHHIEEKLYRNPMKITLQWAAGPGFMPLWKQVKDYGFGVRHFLVVVTEELLREHWPQMSANGGVENLSKFVLVLWGKKQKDLPADLRRLRCPCIEWPVTESKFSSLQREREQFWKRVRLALKDLSD